jgi:hypothetical protein
MPSSGTKINGKNLGRNLPSYDSRKMHYGFYLGQSSTVLTANIPRSFVASCKPISNWRANPNILPAFNFRLCAQPPPWRLFRSALFAGRRFLYPQYRISNLDGKEDQEVASTTVQLPFFLKYSAKRRKNSRMYFVAGVRLPSILAAANGPNA